jgi:hypothetical protein
VCLRAYQYFPLYSTLCARHLSALYALPCRLRVVHTEAADKHLFLAVNPVGCEHSSPTHYPNPLSLRADLVSQRHTSSASMQHQSQRFVLPSPMPTAPEYPRWPSSSGFLSQGGDVVNGSPHYGIGPLLQTTAHVFMAGPRPDSAPAGSALRYKTRLCESQQTGRNCPYGGRCLFAHGERDLRTVDMNVQDRLTTWVAVTGHQDAAKAAHESERQRRRRRQQKEQKKVKRRGEASAQSDLLCVAVTAVDDGVFSRNDDDVDFDMSPPFAVAQMDGSDTDRDNGASDEEPFRSVLQHRASGHLDSFSGRPTSRFVQARDASLTSAPASPMFTILRTPDIAGGAPPSAPSMTSIVLPGTPQELTPTTVKRCHRPYSAVPKTN